MDGPRNRLLLTSFQTSKRCSAGKPPVPLKCVASAWAKSPSAEAFGVPASTPCGRFAKAQLGVSLTSRIGVTPAASACLTTVSSPSQLYPGEVGSVATKRSGRVDGAIADHETAILTYVALAERASAKAFSRSELLKRAGSTTAVASGAVPCVRYVRTAGVAWVACRAFAAPAEEVTAARDAIAPTTARLRAATPTSRTR